MKVLLHENVWKLGQIGEIVEVKPGYARNYLRPQGLASEPTPTNIKAVEAAKEKYLLKLAEQKSELQAKANLIDGKEVRLTARANEEGHLYGSIGPAQIAALLAQEDCFVEEKYILIGEPIRQLGYHKVVIDFGEKVTAKIQVAVAGLDGIIPVVEEKLSEVEVSSEMEVSSEVEAPEEDTPAENAAESQE